MNHSTKTPDTCPERTWCETGNQPQDAHLFNPDALEWATAVGLPCRAFCGVWAPYTSPEAPDVLSHPGEAWGDDDTCPDCLDWWERHYPVGG